MAPEVIFGREYSYSVDFYALGVLLLQLLTGKRIDVGHTIESAVESHNNRKWDQKFLSKKFPDLSESAISLILKLIDPDPSQRLGWKNGARDIMEHSFFNFFDFGALNDGIMLSPFCHIRDKKCDNTNPLLINKLEGELRDEEIKMPSFNVSQFNMLFDEFESKQKHDLDKNLTPRAKM